MTEFEQRRRDIASRFTEQKIDALLVTSSANVRYLSGFSGSNGLILLLPGESHFFTDPRYAIAAQTNTTGKVHVARGPLAAAAAAIIKRKKIKRVGFEGGWLHYEDFAKLKDLLPLGSNLRPVGRIIEQRRMLKSPDEIEKIHKSVQINSEAFLRTMRRVRAGVREIEIAAELEFQMKLLGAEKPAFDTIVAAGPHSALPHAHPTDHRLEGDELLLVDMGALHEGYSSDMTRVVYVGQAPPPKIRSLYKAVLEAQLAGIDAVRPGVAAGKVDAAARNVLKKYKLDQAFVHSTGHGLGLEIHEPPRIGKKDPTPLQPGMAITIEPGAYLEGLGGIRIEDTVLVTESGCQILTPTPKEFVHL